MNDKIKTFYHKESNRTSISLDQKKTTNNVLNGLNKIKLGDKFGPIFDNKKLVCLDRKICTPTTDWKNYEIKRKEFRQKIVMEPQVSKDYLKMLVKLLNKKDKNYLKERQALNVKCKKQSDKEKKDLLNRVENKESIVSNSTLRLENIFSYQSRNKMASTFHPNNYKTEVSPLEKNAFSNISDNKYPKKYEMDELSSINPNCTTQNKLFSEQNFHKIDNIPYFLLENYNNQHSEDEITEENHPVLKTDSRGSQLSNFDEKSKYKIFYALQNQHEEKKINKKKKEKIVLNDKKKKKNNEIDQIPFVRNVKLILKDFRIINQKANFENELQKIYVYKSQEKKRKDINDDLFRRIKEIDHKRNKKLREMFSK